LNRAFALIAAAGLAVTPLHKSLSAQDLPEELKGEALAVKVHALVPAAAAAGGQGAAAWQEESVKYTIPGVPVGVKLLGSNVVIITQVTPFARGDGNLTLVAQGQIWIRSSRGNIIYHTTMETVTVSLGETVFFYPFGVDAAGKSPLRIEISVTRNAAAKEGEVAPKPTGADAPAAAAREAPSALQPSPAPSPQEGARPAPAPEPKPKR
jgi:hypothetical protein